MAKSKRSFKDICKAVLDFFKKLPRRFWEYAKVAKAELIVMAALFAVDLISKAIVNATVGLYQSVTLIPYFLNISNYHNYAAAMGVDWMVKAFGENGARAVFCIIAILATIAFIYIMVRCKKSHILFRISLAMLAAGAMGNCIDRMFLGYVRDFIEFVYFGKTVKIHFWFIDYEASSFYIFNIADAALTIGATLMVVYFLFIYKDKADVEVVKAAEGETAEGPDTTEPAEQGEKAPDSGADGQSDSVLPEQEQAPENAAPSEKNTPAEQAEAAATEQAEAQAPTEPAEPEQGPDGGEKA